MKRFISLFLILCMSVGPLNIAQAEPKIQSASPELERSYLVQLVNQLEATIPLITAAQKAQPKNQRISFHYTAWREAKGQLHNGLLEDVQLIKAGVEEKLNAASIEPRTVQPIRGDYVDQATKDAKPKSLK